MNIYIKLKLESVDQKTFFNQSVEFLAANFLPQLTVPNHSQSLLYLMAVIVVSSVVLVLSLVLTLDVGPPLRQSFP